MSKKRKAIGDGDDLFKDSQDMDIAFKSNWGGGCHRNLALPDGICNKRNIVDTMMAALVENSDKSVGGTLLCMMLKIFPNLTN